MDGIHFEKSDIGSPITPFGDHHVQINGSPIHITGGYGDGKIHGSRWQGDSLVLTDSNGNQHFFVTVNRSFIAYKGESIPHDNIGWKEALKEERKYRERAEKKKGTETNLKGKNAKSTKKKSFIGIIFKGLWWLIKKTVKILFIFGINHDQKDK